MKKTTFFCSLAAVLLIIANTRAQDTASLSASAKVNKTQLVVGEPLVVELTTTNTGKTPINLWYSPDIGCVFISKDGKNYKHFSDGMRKDAKSSPFTLEPGKTVTTHFVVLYSLGYGVEGKVVGEFAFPKPGTYFIQGGYEGTLETNIRTKALEITVKEPEGEDLEAWKQLRDVEAYGRLMQFPESVPQHEIDRLSKIVKEHPKSIYSSYVNAALEKHPLPPKSE